MHNHINANYMLIRHHPNLWVLAIINAVPQRYSYYCVSIITLKNTHFRILALSRGSAESRQGGFAYALVYYD